MSVLQRCPSYRESNERSKERQGPTLGVRFTEVSVKRESTIIPKSKTVYTPVFFRLVVRLIAAFERPTGKRNFSRATGVKHQGKVLNKVL